MTLDTLIMLSGAFVLLLPQLGFPHSWDTALLTILGIVIIALGIAVRRGVAKSFPVEKPMRGYEESRPSRHIATIKKIEPLDEHESE